MQFFICALAAELQLYMTPETNEINFPSDTNKRPAHSISQSGMELELEDEIDGLCRFLALADQAYSLYLAGPYVSQRHASAITEHQ